MYLLTTKILRCLFWGVLAVCAVVLAACLGLRYLVLPRIDQWRPRIEQYVSRALGAPVRIDAISADWSGLNPRLHLSAVRFYEGPDKPQPVAVLPAVDAVVAWRSVLRLSPRLLSLRIDGADLSARRDASGRVWVAGVSFDPDSSASGYEGIVPALTWLSEQGQLALTEATLRWIDEQRQAPELVFSHVNVFLVNGVLSHRFALQATPPQALSAGITVRGEIDRRLFGALGHAGAAGWDGDFYAQLDDTEPSAWSPWMTLPQARGRFAARAWVRLTRGEIGEVTLDAAIRGLDAALPGQNNHLAARQVHLHLDGVPGDLDVLPAGVLPLPLAHSGGKDSGGNGGDGGSSGSSGGGDQKPGQGMALQVQAQGIETSLPEIFDAPKLQADTLRVDASLTHPSGQALTLDLHQLHIENSDFDLALQGHWRDEGKAGIADIQGKFARVSLPAVSRYLPGIVGPHTRHWFATSLLEGQAADVTVMAKGPLAEFPFMRPEDTGQFRMAGRYQGARVDYAPALADRKGWPALSGLSGNFVMDRASLTVDSVGGRMETGPGQQVELHEGHAVIPDMEHDAQLDVTGASSGAAPAYLAIATNSPLGALLDGVLDDAEGSGGWQVSLALHVPLGHSKDTQGNGRILFQGAGNTFQLTPQLPVMSDLQGELAFSEHGLQANNLRGTFLGGPMLLSGKLGNGDALAFSGTLAASALGELGSLPAFKRFTGKTAYQGKLSYSKGGEVNVSVQSNLTGLAIDLPAPLGKAAAGAMPLTLQWSPASNAGGGGNSGGGRRWLSGGIGQNINLMFERNPSARGAYFTRGAIGLGRAASLPASGLSLSGTLDALDVDAWNEALKSFTPASSAAQGKPSAQFTQTALPRLELANLSVRHLVAAGQDFDDLTLYAQQPVPGQWRASIASRQATGTLEWAEASNKSAGKILARFDRLTLGKADEEDSSKNDKSNKSGDKSDQSGKSDKSGKTAKSSNDGKGYDLSDIPDLDVQAKQFVLYGHEVGSLNVAGANLKRGELWRLDKLNIANASATLDAAGSWRLLGPARGLSTDARLNFKDLGATLDRLGLHPVSGGSGVIEGKLFWRDFPWRYDKTNIEGSLHTAFEKGRFVNLGSHTARLLQLLSLQSISRLASFSSNPANLLRQGFPFDTVTGDMRLSKGVMTLDDYKISGPAAAIALEGTSDIINERWNLHAVVVPNLDASGAAIAAALVNPVVGLGAFVTQWLLKQPLARAMAVEYRVTGTWDDPKVETVERKAPDAQDAAPGR